MENVVEFLEHHGVKGMHWGIRQKRQVNKDRSYFRNLDGNTLDKINKTALTGYNKSVKEINNKPAYKNKDLTKNAALRQKYYVEHAQSLAGYLDKALAKHASQVSPNGHFAAQFVVEPGTNAAFINVYRVRHVDHADGNLRFNVVFDDLGHVIKIIDPGDSMEQDSMNVEEFLEHHGVKGQKWGIRNRRNNVTKAKAKKPSLDYRRSQEIRRQKHPYLTNKQIEVANKRANLEQNFSRLNPTKVKKGHQMASSILKGVGIGSIAALSSPQGQDKIKKALNFLGPSINKGVRTIGRTK